MTKEMKFMTKCYIQQTIKNELKKIKATVSKIHTQMYGYFTNKSKHRLIIKNKHKYMAIYYKNRKRKCNSIGRLDCKITQHKLNNLKLMLVSF